MRLLQLDRQSETNLRDGLATATSANSACAFTRDVYRQFIGEADLRHIAALGFDVVRVPINYRAIDTPSSPGWAVLDRLIGWAAANHVYVILDLHSAPGGQGTLFVSDPGDVSLWDSPKSQDETVRIWTAIARRYANDTIIAGYDLLNEPKPPDGADLVAFYGRLIAAIRSVDAHHLVLLEGTSAATDFSAFTKLLDSNEAYTFHMYTWFGDHRDEKLAEYDALARAQQVPFWCGEFGENSYAMIASTVAKFDSHALSGWSFWTWKKALGTNSHPGLAGFDSGPRWKSLIGWLVNPRPPKPSASFTAAAESDFLESVQWPNISVDPEMAAALSTSASP